MAHCPFCGGDVEESLVLYGGPCPRCFAEIPGEEAATDPGEEVKQKEERVIKRRAAFRALIPVLLGVPTVAGLCVAVLAWVLWPEPELQVLDMDEIVYIPDVGSFQPVEEPEKVEEVDPKKPRKPRTVRKSAPPPTEDLTPDWMKGAPSTTPSSSYRRSTGGPLDDPKAIREMIARVLAAEVPKLNSCYERRLKLDPAFGGSWKISLTVTPEGTVLSPDAVGLGLKDADFETCVEQKVARWQFLPIVGKQPVLKTVTFRS